MAFNYFKAASHKTQVFFQWNVRIAHGACSNHAAFSFFTEGFFQKFRSILFYFDIFKIMSKLIALTARVAIDTAMGTSAVNVHTVRSQNCFSGYKVHEVIIPFKYDMCQVTGGRSKMLANKIYLDYNKNLVYIFIYRGSNDS